MRAIYIILFLTVLLGSCKTLKNNNRTKSDVQTDSIVKSDIEVNLNEKDLTELDSQLKQKETLVDSSFERIIIREFNVDSTGKSNIKKETIYEKQSAVKNTRETSLSEDIKNNITKSMTKKDHSKTDFQKRETLKTASSEKSFIPIWVYLIVLIIFIAACLVIGWWIKKKLNIII
jgi:cobalamin biosynthesis Mg chelatase CobN